MILDLREASDPMRVGGKAFGLGTMLRAGITVPPGFVIEASAFERFVRSSGRASAIETLRSRARADDPAATSDAAAQIEAWLAQIPIPADLGEELRARFVALGAARGVVRSSAVGEDAAETSFAGQLDSFLGVDLASLLGRVRACWISLYSARSLAYQHATGVALRRMGVVVQPEIPSVVSGVTFTRSPLDPLQMRIEHVQGSCEALVSGLVVPHCTNAGPDGHNGSPWLSKAQLSEMIAVFRALEAQLGGPQDIEWTIDPSGQLFILQSRPITAARPLKDDSERVSLGEAEVAVFSNANINENYPGPVTFLLQSIAKTSYQHYFRNIATAYGFAPRRIAAMEESLANLVSVHGQRLYYDVSNLHAVLRMAPFGETFAAWFNSFVGVEETTNARERDLTWRRGTTSRVFEAAELARIAVAVTRQYSRLTLQVETFEATVAAYAARSTPSALRALDIDGLLGLFSDFMDIRCHRWIGAGLADGACMVCCGALQRFLGARFETPASVLLHGLLRGLPDIVSSEPPRQLWLLSRTIRQDPSLFALFAMQTPAVLDRLGWDGEAMRADLPFARALQRFLDEWGFRCTGELMLTVDSFQERPEAVIDMLRVYASMTSEGPDELIARQAAARLAETEQLAATLSRPHRRAFRLLLTATSRSLSLRERARLKQALLYRRLRRVVLAIGERQHAAGTLQQPDDVLHMTWTEIEALRSGWLAPTNSIAARRAAFAEQSLWPDPPARLSLPRHQRWTPPSTLKVASTKGDRLEGLAAAGGSVTARATVARSQADFHKVAAGDVLVAPQTDPGWATVLFLVRGLVMERGGMLSHGAIIAREFGIPSVVAVEQATERIANGATVTVDGDRGLVHILQ